VSSPASVPTIFQLATGASRSSAPRRHHVIPFEWPRKDRNAGCRGQHLSRHYWQKTSTGTTFPFFDPSQFYSYELDAAGDVEELVARCAGPRAELGN
jgi:hypothetical protein